MTARTEPSPPWDGVHPLLWHRLISEVEQCRQRTGLGLASVWGPIRQQDYKAARAEMDRVLASVLHEPRPTRSTRRTEPNPFAHRAQRPYAELIPDVLAAEYAVRTDASETVTSLVAGFAPWERRWDARTRTWHVASWRADELAAALRRNRFDVRFGVGQ